MFAETFQRTWNCLKSKTNHQTRIHRLFSSKSRSSKGNERLWAVGALTIGIPAAAWIYNRHQEKTQASSLSGGGPAEKSVAIVFSDLKDIQSELTKEPSLPNNTAISSANSSSMPLTESHMHAKYLLIGAGTASFAALEEIKRLEPHADILMIGEEEQLPYMRPPLSKEVWFNTDKSMIKALHFTDWHGEEKPVFYQSENFFETKQLGAPNFKPRLLMGRRAVKLDTETKTVVLDNGQVIVYGKVLIATGGTPKLLPQVEDSKDQRILDRVSTFRGIKDLEKLVAAASQSKSIAIVGGGFLGSELAVALAQYNKNHLDGKLQITQLFPEKGNMALVFPRYLSNWTMSKIKKAGVKILPNTMVSDVKMLDEGLSLKLSDNSALNVDHLIVAIGIEPNIELARSAGLELDTERGGIVANSQLQICHDVYAAGDVISFHDQGLGIRRRVEHYDHAILSGRTAAANMVGHENNRNYSVQSMFWSDLGPEIGYEAVGLVDSKLTTVGVWAEAAALDSPKAADLDPLDIRVQSIGTVTSRANEPNKSPEKPLVESVIPSPVGEKSYGKGVVFYVKDQRIVGLLMFNLFNRLALARDVINKRTSIEELETIVDLFNISNGQ